MSSNAQDPATSASHGPRVSSKEKLKIFCKSDPRWRIMRTFQKFTLQQEVKDPKYLFLKDVMKKSGPSAFSVWRPTSKDAIQKMMLGQGTGKGLDVKGKSAKTGVLSGFVPYVQIHNNEEHKNKVGTCPRDARVSIFFKTKDLRDLAAIKLDEVLRDMVNEVDKAEKCLAKEDNPEEAFEEAVTKMMWKTDDPNIHELNRYVPNCFGVDIPERLFWEACIMRGKCIREKGSDLDTGRDSVPQYFYLNMKCTRDKNKDRKAVVLQWRDSPDSDPLDPMTLLVAYEENGTVTPVVSDFDPFLIGTRGVEFNKQLDPEQVQLMKWSVNETQQILEQKSNSTSWTMNWLNVLKDASKKGHLPAMPQYGYGDPVSVSMIESAVKDAERTGAVRHGAECFNYYFPQELDEEFLVISPESFGNMPYLNMKKDELKEFLLEQVKKGYTFPLNPKWILCDKGWIDVWYALRSSKFPFVRDSLNVWFPPESGIVEQIDQIVEAHPDGLESSADSNDISLALLQLERQITLRRAKKKLRAAILWLRLSHKSSKGDTAKSNNVSEEKEMSQTGNKASAAFEKMLLDINIKTKMLSFRERQLKEKEKKNTELLKSKDLEFARKEAKFNMLHEETSIKNDRLKNREEDLQKKIEKLEEEKLLAEKQHEETIAELKKKEQELLAKETQLQRISEELEAKSVELSVQELCLKGREEAFSRISSRRRRWYNITRKSDSSEKAKQPLVNIPSEIERENLRSDSVNSIASELTHNEDFSDQHKKRRFRKILRKLKNTSKATRVAQI